MKKINWKIRLRNGTFWPPAIAALLMFLFSLADLIGIKMPVDMQAVMNVAMMLLAFLAAVGVISDPTTPGIGDSTRALGYTVPGGTPEE